MLYFFCLCLKCSELFMYQFLYLNVHPSERYCMKTDQQMETVAFQRRSDNKTKGILTNRFGTTMLNKCSNLWYKCSSDILNQFSFDAGLYSSGNRWLDKWQGVVFLRCSISWNKNIISVVYRNELHLEQIWVCKKFRMFIWKKKNLKSYTHLSILNQSSLPE